ncbi:hypothetical protein WJX73_000182 [Symbiochloris irregularis]|uniref:Laccase n=1 Tax=Symbiochloris irregularis TaxID=706552 RepID=A0AAW1P2P2_9CHLO
MRGTICFGSLAFCLAFVAATTLGQTGPFPILNIPVGEPLPILNDISEKDVYLELVPNTITGPGNNETGPYVTLTARVFNNSLTAGVIRLLQGDTFRLRICNKLNPTFNTLAGPEENFDYMEPLNFGQQPVGGLDYYKDPNLFTSHLHGYFGNPGTNVAPCKKTNESDAFCVGGDNIFIDINPGQCGEYRLPIAPISSPGVYWLHPHQQGSAVNQLNTASLPVIIDQEPKGGFDFLSAPSCQKARRAFTEGLAPEIVINIQALFTAVNYDGWGPGPGNDHTGPTDDGTISTAVQTFPGDPYCCKGPTEVPQGDFDAGGGIWNDTGDVNGTGPGIGVSNSILPFYSSGADAELALLNGAYQPTIAMDVGKAYLFRMVDAMTMKILDLTINSSACQMGIVNRDSIPLKEIPRMTDHIFMGPANRVEAFIQCNEPGEFAFQTGYGPQQLDPQCTTTHCELVTQTLATLIVTEPTADSKPGISLEDIGYCQATYPLYLNDLRDESPSLPDKDLRQTLNMVATNPAMAVTDFNLSNPSPVHPFHHHVQPYQLVSMVNPYGTPDNGTWQVGDWLDTLLLPNIANQAVIRWHSGPADITGQGYFLMHCHIIPHSDQGCALKSQIVAQPTPLGAIAPITAGGGAESLGRL